MRGFVQSDLGARLASAAALRREAEFAFPLGLDTGEVTVNGFVDAVAREGDGALVVDYKTDRLEPAEDPEARVARDYRTQRLVYALAALRDGASSVEVVHCFLERPGEPASARFAATDAPALEAELRGLAQGVAAGRFDPSPRPNRRLCLECPARRSLCSWDEPMTLRDPDDA